MANAQETDFPYLRVCHFLGDLISACFNFIEVGPFSVPGQ